MGFVVLGVTKGPGPEDVTTRVRRSGATSSVQSWQSCFSYILTIVVSINTVSGIKKITDFCALRHVLYSVSFSLIFWGVDTFDKSGKRLLKYILKHVYHTDFLKGNRTLEICSCHQRRPPPRPQALESVLRLEVKFWDMAVPTDT